MKNRMAKLGVGLLTVLLALNIYGATVYFVDPVGGNDASGGTSTGTAWLHMPGAQGVSAGAGWHQLVNGDTLVLKGGVSNLYSVQMNATWYSGSAAYDSITIISGDIYSSPWGSGRAIFDEQFTRTLGIGIGGTSGATVQGITLNGLEIRNIKGGASGDAGGDGSCCVGISGNVTMQYILVRNCWIHDSLRDATDHGHGIEMTGSRTSALLNNIVVTQCRFWNIGSKGIEPGEVNGGALTNNAFFSTGDHSIAATRANHLDIANNVFFFTNASTLSPAGAVTLPSADYCDVWNNVIFKQSAASLFGRIGFITYVAGTGGSTSLTNRIVFNMLADIYSTDSDHFSVPARFGEYQGTGISYGNLFQNNIVYLSRTANFLSSFMYSLGNTLDDNNQYNDYWYSASSDAVIDSNSGGVDTLTTVANVSLPAGHTFANNQQKAPVFVGGTLPTDLDINYVPNTRYWALTTGNQSALTNTANAILGDASHGYRHDAAKFKYDIAGVDRTASYPMGAYAYGTGGGGGLDIVITVQPTSQTIFNGQTAAFSVTATGGALTYQWYTNSVAVGGGIGTSSTYTTPTIPSTSWNGTTVYVIITDASGLLNSVQVTLTVNADPAITVQPQNQTVPVGAPATFTVTATGQTALSYQWSWFGTNVTGATATSMTLNNLNTAHSGSSVSVVATDTAGSVTSQNAILTVTSPSTIINATTISVQRAHLNQTAP